MGEHARVAVQTGRAGSKTPEQVLAELLENLLPNVFPVPFALAETARLQLKGYPHIYVPNRT